jgi:hypothetical protein
MICFNPEVFIFCSSKLIKSAKRYPNTTQTLPKHTFKLPTIPGEHFFTGKGSQLTRGIIAVIFSANYCI